MNSFNSSTSTSFGGAGEMCLTMSAKEWFGNGESVLYDPVKKAIVSRSAAERNPNSKNDYVNVWERTFIPPGNPLPRRTTRWLTLLPRFPDGSFGYSKLHPLLSTAEPRITTPRLYLDYIGQGGSDPLSNADSTKDRADLVQALWQSHGVQRTVVFSLDDSSLVLMELLRRQAEGTCTTRIEHVLIVNGALFADGHSFPRLSRWGSLGAGLAPKVALKAILQPLFSKTYRALQPTVVKQETRQIVQVMRNHGGMAVVERASKIFAEHIQNYPERWDLVKIMEQIHDTGITVHIVGSDEHRSKQTDLAIERLGDKYSQEQVKIETIEGGHLVAFECPLELTRMIQNLAEKISNVGDAPDIQQDQSNSYRTGNRLFAVGLTASTRA